MTNQLLKNAEHLKLWKEGMSGFGYPSKLGVVLTLGYPSKKGQCVVLENTCTVGNATLCCFKDNPEGIYRVIEGNWFF